MSRYGVKWTPGARPGKSIDMSVKMQRVTPPPVVATVSIAAPAPTGKPDLFPFPWEQVLPRMNAGEDGEQATFYNNAAHDAVSLKVNVVADPASLANASYSTGFMPPGWPMGQIQVGGGVHFTDGFYAPAVDLDLWRYTGYWSVSNVISRYTDSDSVWGGVVAPGVRTYPGVSSLDPWQFSAYFEVTDVGKPVLFEVWFADNPAKTSGTTEFNGYTLFGDQGGGVCFAGVGKLGNAGECIKKYVSGILKVSADSTNPQISDIMYGVMYTGTAAGGTGVIVVNGQITQTGTLSQAATDVGGGISTSFSGTAEQLAGYAGSPADISLWVSDATYTYPVPPGSFIGISDSVSLPLNHLNYDTKEVKFVNYVDRTSGLADGTPTGQSIWCSWPMMYTHPGWPVATPAPVVAQAEPVVAAAAPPPLKTMRVRVEV